MFRKWYVVGSLFTLAMAYLAITALGELRYGACIGFASLWAVIVLISGVFRLVRWVKNRTSENLSGGTIRRILGG